MKRAFAFALFLAMPAGVFAQTGDAPSHHKSSTQSSAVTSTSGEIQELKAAVAAQKDAIAAQQQQIQMMQQQIQSRDQAIQTLQKRVDQADSAASQAQQTAQSALSGENKEGEISASDFNTLQHDVTDLKAANASAVESLTATEKRVGDLESPLAIHFKGITLTPGGFVAADTVWRAHAMYSDIGTQYNAVPFSASGQARSSDFYGSGRASRLSLLAKGNWGQTVLTGYYEADFLGVGVASTNNQSNSYVLRQRQLWSQAAFHNGWSVAGGQMWSLATEFKSGLDPFTWLSPQVIDTQYNAGFSYLRQ
jgi:TolA-binding protein